MTNNDEYDADCKIFKFDTSSGTNKWSQIARSSVSSNITAEDFVSKYRTITALKNHKTDF